MYTTKTELDVAVATALKAASAYYHSGDTTMSDAEYDLIVENIALTVEDNPQWASQETAQVLSSVAAGTSSKGDDVEHERPMLSLDKVKTLDNVSSFATKVQNASGVSEILVEPKLDGSAMSVKYVDGILVQAVTRGDGAFGKDVTDRMKAMDVVGLPTVLSQPVNGFIRGEVYMSDSQFVSASASRVNMARVAHQTSSNKNKGDFDATKFAFANSRNATSGLINRDDDPGFTVEVSFAGYDVEFDEYQSDSYVERLDAAKNLGIVTAKSLLDSYLAEAPGVDDFTTLDMINFIGDNRAVFPFPIDGAVIKANSMKTREKMGMSSRHPRWATAFKYEAQRSVTTLLGIERTVGRTGNVAYTALLSPVEVDGSMVAKATLHNAAFIAEKDLRIGDKVFVHKAGDIIPRVEEAILSERTEDLIVYVAPTTCPKCGEEMDTTSSIIWRCETPSCGIASAVEYAVSRDCLDIDGFSTAVANALIDQGKIKDVADLFALTTGDLSGLVMGTTTTGNARMLGEKTAQKIYDGIQKAKTQPLNRIICALGIRKTGRTMSRRIAEHFKTMDAVLAASENDFLEVEGVASGKADYIYRGFRIMEPTIASMAAQGVNMESNSASAAVSGPQATVDGSSSSNASQAVLAGKKVVVTGSMAGSALDGKNRNEVNELIESFGGKSSGSVSSSTDILVCGEEGSSKWSKAKSLGTVEILTPTEFAALLGI